MSVLWGLSAVAISLALGGRAARSDPTLEDPTLDEDWIDVSARDGEGKFDLITDRTLYLRVTQVRDWAEGSPQRLEPRMTRMTDEAIYLEAPAMRVSVPERDFVQLALSESHLATELRWAFLEEVGADKYRLCGGWVPDDRTTISGPLNEVYSAGMERQQELAGCRTRDGDFIITALPYETNFFSSLEGDYAVEVQYERLSLDQAPIPLMLTARPALYQELGANTYNLAFHRFMLVMGAPRPLGDGASGTMSILDETDLVFWDDVNRWRQTILQTQAYTLQLDRSQGVEIRSEGALFALVDEWGEPVECNKGEDYGNFWTGPWSIDNRHDWFDEFLLSPSGTLETFGADSTTGRSDQVYQLAEHCPGFDQGPLTLVVLPEQSWGEVGTGQHDYSIEVTYY